MERDIQEIEVVVVVFPDQALVASHVHKTTDCRWVKTAGSRSDLPFLLHVSGVHLARRD